ncbi:MAG: sulfotransferase [Acidobacteriota bacterium]
MTETASNPTPIFLLSLPRAGSTLVQRVLAAHPEIATATEPHLLLPFVYAMRDRGVASEYSHRFTSFAIQDFSSRLPNGVADFDAELRLFVRRLYHRAGRGDTRYFLDKTPKYHLIVDDIVRIFPEARLIFLWRNPLAVVASLMETWARGRWNLFLFDIDLFDGLANLLATYQACQNRALAMTYEDLVSNHLGPWERLFSYLDLPFAPALLSRFAEVEMKGRIRDPRQSEYRSLSQEPLEKWRATLGNPIRKAYCRRYLRWIGQERLSCMGYDLQGLLADLASVPTSVRFLASDLWRIPIEAAKEVLHLREVSESLRILLRRRQVRGYR